MNAVKLAKSDSFLTTIIRGSRRSAIRMSKSLILSAAGSSPNAAARTGCGNSFAAAAPSLDLGDLRRVGLDDRRDRLAGLADRQVLELAARDVVLELGRAARLQEHGLELGIRGRPRGL